MMMHLRRCHLVNLRGGDEQSVSIAGHCMAFGTRQYRARTCFKGTISSGLYILNKRFHDTMHDISGC
jgi:hypothetical protein